MTAADHANTLREALSTSQADDLDEYRGWLAALDALLAQAETTVRERDQAQDALRRGVAVATQYMDTGRGDLDGWIELARAALAARDEAWTHADRMVLGEGGC